MSQLSTIGLDLRAAAEWTKRNGYSFDETTDQRIDGRDLWSSRITVGFKPSSDLQTYLVWEHFSEDDDRLRSGKQLSRQIRGQRKSMASFSLQARAPI